MNASKSVGKSDSLPLFLLKGAVIGLVATQVLDLVGTYIYDREDPKLRAEENKTRGGRQAYEVGVAKIAKGFGRTLTRQEEKVWGWRFHKTFGVIGGLQFLALRRKSDKVGAAWGLAFGFAFFLIADEILIYLAKLTPGPQNFSWKVHGRGALAHTAYGVAAETTARAFENLPKIFIKEDAYLLPQH